LSRIVGCLVCLLIVPPLACRRQPSPEESSAAGAGSERAKLVESLVFPDEMRVSDASINEFVTKAMTVCATGDYEAFRLLWSAREDPLPRSDFEQGWHAVRGIEVRALQKAMLEADPSVGRENKERVYVLLVDVTFDPAQKPGQNEPLRHVVLMVVSENDDWRLAKAPKAMREWVKNKVTTADPRGDNNVAPPIDP